MRRILSRRGGPIPCSGIVRPLATEQVMLIGDAAGMVSPLTAGGIHNALRFGRRGAAGCGKTEKTPTTVRPIRTSGSILGTESP